MLNSAFLYSFQSNKETENQMFLEKKIRFKTTKKGP